jgi:hypothetical protein
MAIATSTQGLAVVEEDDVCQFCSVEEAVKVTERGFRFQGEGLRRGARGREGGGGHG